MAGSIPAVLNVWTMTPSDRQMSPHAGLSQNTRTARRWPSALLSARSAAIDHPLNLSTFQFPLSLKEAFTRAVEPLTNVRRVAARGEGQHLLVDRRQLLPMVLDVPDRQLDVRHRQAEQLGDPRRGVPGVVVHHVVHRDPSALDLRAAAAVVDLRRG